MLALHDLLHDERGGDVQRHAGVVPFAVPRRAVDDRIVIGDAGLLRRLRDAVDVGAERDDRLARAPARHPRGRNAGQILLHGKAVFPENPGDVLRRLELLKPELAEAEDLIVHPRDVFAHAVDLKADVALVLLQLRVGGSRRRRRDSRLTSLVLPAGSLARRCAWHGARRRAQSRRQQHGQQQRARDGDRTTTGHESSRISDNCGA